MTSTHTATAAFAKGPQPRAATAWFGQERFVQYTNANASLSAGDVIAMMKIPTGSVITGWRINYKLFDDTQGLFTVIAQTAGGNVALSTTLTGSSTKTFGYDSEYAVTTGSFSSTGSARLFANLVGTGLPYVMSLSDDAKPQYGLVSVLIASGTTTTQSVILNLGVTYYRGFSGD